MAKIEVVEFFPHYRDDVPDPDMDPMRLEFRMRIPGFRDDAQEGYFMPLQLISHHQEFLGIEDPGEALQFTMKHWYAAFFPEEMKPDLRPLIVTDGRHDTRFCAHTDAYLEYVNAAVDLAAEIDLSEVEPVIPLLRSDPVEEQNRAVAELMRVVRGTVAPHRMPQPGVRTGAAFHAAMAWDPAVKRARKRTTTVREERLEFAAEWQEHMSIAPSAGLDEALEFLDANRSRVRSLSNHIAEEALRFHPVQSLSFRLARTWRM